MINWKTDYPSQYYAYSNTTAMFGGYPSVGWVDVGIFTNKPSWLPAASDMIALTTAEWEGRSSADQIIKDGKIVAYTTTTTTATSTATTAT